MFATILSLLLSTSYAGEISFDSVLVVPFHPHTPELRVDAERVADLIATRLGNDNLVISMREVPDFAEGYDAYTYMAACPDGKYSGCTFVVADRAGVDWAISGEVRDDIDGVTVSVWMINVKDSEVVLSFGVLLTGDNDEDFAEGVETVFGKVLAGEAETVDVRGNLQDAAVQQELEAARAEVAADAIDELAESMGGVSRTGTGINGPTKISKADLERLARGDDGAPWLRVGMTATEYRRFNNSGRSIEEWKEAANGRFGQLIGRISFGGGGGPYEQYFDGRVLQDNTTLQPIEISAYQEAISGGSTSFSVELGFGVLPFLDLTGVLSMQSAKFRFLTGSQVIGQDSVPFKEQPATRVGTTMAGARATLAPLPTSLLRPSLAAGFAVWKGTEVGKVVALPANYLVDGGSPVGAPALLILQIMPGAEVSVAKNVTLFARLRIDAPMGGKATTKYHDGVTVIGNPSPNGKRSMGVGFEGGLMFRLGLLKPKTSGFNPLLDDSELD